MMKKTLDRILSNKKSATLVVIFCMLLWGSAIPTIKTTYTAFLIDKADTGAKILTAGIRFFMAGLLTYFYMFLFGKNKVEKKNINWRYIIVLSIIQTSLQYLLYYIGLSNTTGVKSSIIQASNAFFVVILAAILIPDEKLSPGKILALLIGTGGILIANYKPGSASSFKISGEGAILASTCFNAFSTVYVRWRGRGEDAFFTTSAQFILGSVILIIVGLAAGGAGGIHFSVRGALLLAYGAFISATAYTLYTLVLHHQPAGEVGFYKLFIPIFGSLLSIIFLGEMFNLQLLIGLFLLITGTYILNMDKK